MNSPDDRADSILKAALEMSDHAAREAFIDTACKDDLALEVRVRRRLEACEHGSTASEHETVSPEAEAEMARLKPEESGERIDHYKLLEQIGEGGFGVVWIAEQAEPVRRRVALKIIKLGMDTKEFIARFEQERQALALMDHPNIARVLDAGATEHGRPFFVMELVRGVKITDYCDQQALSMAERLKLFARVCEAVQHAHQKGIIHRDLKPSNILVTINDGVPVPKVIDFGVAKATQGRLTEHTVYTQFQQMVGTPRYMSPEQAEMTSLDIDTRSDIYSLGILLYELLTGCTPLEEQTLARVGLDEIRRAIREVDAVRPSTRVMSLPGDELTSTAKRRQMDAARLPSALCGELDWIVMKAIEKDRTRRYETANGLAMDVQRYLNNEPILARPPSKLYRFQKTVRRNKLAFAAAAALVLALVLGAVASTWQAVRASRADAASRRAANEAVRAQQQAEAINQFLTKDLLFQATPDENAREKKVTMEEVLEKAARNLDDNPDIANNPEVEGTLRLAVGNTYFKLGLLSEAERNLRLAVMRRKAALGPQNAQTLVAQEALAWFLIEGLKNSQEGESLSRETWQFRRQVLGPEHRDTLDSMDTYCSALLGQRKLQDAEPLLRECLRVHERVHGAEHIDTLTTLGNLGLLLSNRGALAEADQLLRETLERRTRAGLADKADTFAIMNNLAVNLLLQGRLEESERLLIEARQRARVLFGPEHPNTQHLQHQLARVIAEIGRLDESESIARETLAVRRRITPGLESTGRTLLILGRVLVETNKIDEAEPLLREAQAIFRERCPAKTELTAQAENWLGAIQLARGAYPEAESLLLPSADPVLDAIGALSAAERRAAASHVIKLYEAWGKPDKAAVWRKKREEIPKPANGVGAP